MTRGEECLECHRFDSALCLHCLLEFDPPPTKSYNIGAIFLLKDQEIKFKEKIGSHSDPSQKPRAGLESREPWFSLSSALQTISRELAELGDRLGEEGQRQGGGGSRVRARVVR